VGFEVLTAVTLKNAVFWIVTPCGSCENRRFEENYLFHHLDKKKLTPMMVEAIRSSETSVLARATRSDNPEDGILRSYRRENLKPYIALMGCVAER
jgi:hypothetical protein